MKVLFASTTIIPTLMLGLLVGALQGETTLRWKFNEGEKLDQVLVQDMKMNMQVQGQNVQSSVTQTIDALWTIREVDDQGVATIEQQMERVRMKMVGPQGIGGFELDTDSDEQPTGMAATMAPALKALAKARFVLKMNERGEVLDVSVPEEVTESFQQFAGGGQMGPVMSEEGMKTMIQNGSPSLPAESVDQGESWSQEYEAPMAQIGTMKVTNNLTYKGEEEVEGENLQKIDVEMDLAIEPAEDSAIQMTLKAEDSSGTIYFDNDAGRLDHSKLVQKMVMQLQAGDQTFDQTIDQTVEMRLQPANQ